jgi:ATP-dependent helicase/nuclease subunit A
MTSADLAVDEQVRQAVVGELDCTLFLEAGAGSGKTSCLVSRFVALVESGLAADHIAAITFTEKAAGELVDRIRVELQRRAVDNTRCRDALPMLDNAAIGTLHSFAQRILTEHPIEAGLPPRFTVRDEIASQMAFDARWDQDVDQLLDNPDLEMPLQLLFASGGKLKHLRDVAIAFNANWDLVADRVGVQPPPLPPLDVSNILTGLTTAIALADHCMSPVDKLLGHIQGPVTEFEARLRETIDDGTRLELLNDARLKFSHGQKNNWLSVGIDVVKQQLEELQTSCETLRRQLQEGVLQTLADSLAPFHCPRRRKSTLLRRTGIPRFTRPCALCAPRWPTRPRCPRSPCAALPAIAPRRVSRHRSHPDRTRRSDRIE